VGKKQTLNIKRERTEGGGGRKKNVEKQTGIAEIREIGR
jgi:hypothetical protein